MPTNTLSNQWLIFLGVLLVVGLAAFCFVLWLFRPPAGKHHHKRRKRRQHQRQMNPTLAQTGGLPPPRKPNEPPRGT